MTVTIKENNASLFADQHKNFIAEQSYRRGFAEGAAIASGDDFLIPNEDALESGLSRRERFVEPLEAERDEVGQAIDSLDGNDGDALQHAIERHAYVRGQLHAIESACHAIDAIEQAGRFAEDSPEIVTFFRSHLEAVNAWKAEKISAEDLFYSAPPMIISFLSGDYRVPAEELWHWLDFPPSDEPGIDFCVPTAVVGVDCLYEDSGDAAVIHRWDTSEVRHRQAQLVDRQLPLEKRFVQGLTSARSNLLNAIDLDRQMWEAAARLGMQVNQLAKGQRRTGGWSIDQLAAEFTDRRPYLIDGLLRRGEIMNIIAAPKQGKSWLLYNLLMACAAGGQWFGYEVPRMPVLLIDNELHHEELAYRLGQVARASGVDLQSLKDDLVIEPLRGNRCSIDDIERILATEYEPGRFSLIAIDAFYRILPDKVSENDNGAITQIYNQLDAIASHHDASIVQIHHASKGDQSQKDITDVGAGAGAMTRATDTHITIRPHQLEDCVVVDAVTRSSRQPASRTAQFEWPLWRVLEGVEPALRVPKSGSDRKQNGRDAEGIDDIVRMFNEAGNEWLSRSQIRTRIGMGPDRTNRLVFKMLESGQLDQQQDPRRKRDQEVFRLSANG